MKKMVCQTLLYLPSDLIGHVCKNVWFISSPEDAWAFTFRGAEIKNRHLIFLSDELLRQDEVQINYTVLHEVGHVILDHHNSIDRLQTQTEIKQQEREADNFANKYLQR